jgi:predicted RNA-binding protein with PUA-like domain
MNYWFVKFAPFRYSWEDCLHNGKFEIYSVRNPQARNNLRAMKLGDEVLFYHSQQGNCVMGKMKVIEKAHQDPTTNDNRWASVNFEPVERFQRPVYLNVIKKNQKLSGIRWIKQPRLAIMEISELEFNGIVDNAK